MHDDLNEWRMAVHDLTETERDTNTDSHRASIGLVGEATDDQ